MTRNVELYVREVVDDGRGKVVVVVPNNHQNLLSGDRFVLCYDLSKDDIINAVQNPKRILVVNVDLVVTTIDLGKGMLANELHAGHTAGACFSGRGLDAVHKGCFLRMSAGKPG